MERLSVGFHAPAITWLRREAQRLGITVADLIRRIIDQAKEGKQR